MRPDASRQSFVLRNEEQRESTRAGDKDETKIKKAQKQKKRK